MALVPTLVCTLLVFSMNRPLILAQGPEGYFSGDSYALLNSTLDIRRHTTLSFRTCSHGQLLYQAGANGNYLLLDLLHTGQLELRWKVQEHLNTTLVGSRLINNQWHYVILGFKLGSLFIQVDNTKEIVANATLHSYLLDLDLRSNQPELSIGRGFTGCILQGAGVILNDTSVKYSGVNWTKCPLPDRGDCDGYRINYCLSQPCQKFGICIPENNGYACRCTSRYSGINCEVDTGPLCDHIESKCLNGGVCKEDRMGNSTSCACPPGFTGSQCETMIDMMLCEKNPCQNNGICNLNTYRDGYICSCPPGFTGQDCEFNIDECQSSPCYNGAECTDGINNFTCNCEGTGYRGIFCEVNVNECEENNPCKNGSECFDLYGDYFCQCIIGFGGKNCDEEVNECLSGPCQNGGTCKNLINRYECICPLGFEGINCEINIDDCLNVTCPPFSKCMDGINTYACFCLPGYSGSAPHCFDIDECQSSPCQNEGSCINEVNGFRCQCSDGFTGQLCETNFNECEVQPCQNAASCIDGINMYTCLCSVGYTGQNCELNIDECRSSPCRNGATCIDLIGDYNCSCVDGWHGKDCNIDIDECQLDPCLNNATCNNLVNRYTCSCLPGFSGENCEENIDDCASNPCQNSALCKDLINDFECECLPEYMGKVCAETFNACELTPCQNGATCHSIPPSHDYNCLCNAGFTGRNCEVNIDECVGVECTDGKICFDKIDGFECRCPDGFEGPHCMENINECLSNPCQNKATCEDGIANFTCHCEPGFTGKLCDEDIDECQSSPCVQGICTNSVGSYQCYCRPGFSGNNCNIDFNECLSHPCHNNGSCENLINGYACHCAPGFTGEDCDIDINECESSPCKNGGNCTDGINSFSCACLPGFTGSQCEIDIDECESMPCLNSGACIDRINGFSCNCEDTGFKGELCEINIDDCTPFPCVNDANCTDLIKDYQCECHIGFTGKACEIDVDECSTNPCENEGLCLQRSNRSFYEINYLGHFPEPFQYSIAGGYICHCIEGFRGDNCSENIDDCDPDPCWNGTCIDGINNYTCQCSQGFEGRHCEFDIDECDRNSPCFEGSTCINIIGDYQCICPEGYGGKNCSVELLGCRTHQCQNNASCIPYLIGEEDHRFNCTCTNGFYGQHCEYITTASFMGESHIVKHSTAFMDFSVSFRFRTTIPDGLLAVAKNTSYFALYLRGGSLYLLRNDSNDTDDRQPCGKNLNNANWVSVHLQFQPGIVLLKVTDNQNTYHRNYTNAYNIISFDTAYLGGFTGTLNGASSLLPVHNFIGCMEDIIVNEEWIIPELLGPDTVKVTIGCPRTDQCNPNPCSDHGTCTDLWTSYNCSCFRPFLGKQCNYSYTPATFGYETELSSAEIDVLQEQQMQLKTIANVSMFIRTRKADGLIFYLGSPLATQLSFLASELEEGYPVAVVKLGDNGKRFSEKRGPPLNDGYYHLLEVVLKKLRNPSLELETNYMLSLSINNTLLFNKQIVGHELFAEVLLLGGFPAGRLRRQAAEDSITSDGIGGSVTQHLSDNPMFDGEHHVVEANNNHHTSFPETNVGPSHFDPNSSSNPDSYLVSNSNSGGLTDTSFDPRYQVTSSQSNPSRMLTADGSSQTDSSTILRAEHFKGIIQDIRINDVPIQLFPLIVPYSIQLNSTNNIQKLNVREGVLSDESCNPNNPCFNNGTCMNGWNDYICTCDPKFRGKNCSQTEFCFPNSCPQNSTCLNLDEGFECVSNGTFNEVLSYIRYKAKPNLPDLKTNNITFKYRSQKRGLILYMYDPHPMSSFTIRLVENNSIEVSWQLDNTSSELQLLYIGQAATDGEWHEVEIYFNEFNITAVFDKMETTASTAVNNLNNFSQLIQNADIYVGSITFLKVIDERFVGFRGCLNEIRINNLLLPFFMPEEVKNHPNLIQNFEVVAKASVDTNSCKLCDNNYCQHNSSCESPESSYNCTCSNWYEGQYCEKDVDECLNPLISCNNGTCHNEDGGYYCHCSHGYTGVHCESDIDECEDPDFCEHNGICVNTEGGFNCSCTPEYMGIRCSDLVTITCENNPCHHGGICLDELPKNTTDKKIKYVCECTAGYEGHDCSIPKDFCASSPCVHAEKCESYPDSASYFCFCSHGYSGINCETNINECDNNECENNATCEDGIGQYTCICPPGFFGTYCESDFDECEMNPCFNANCSNTHGSYDCHCNDGYIGKNCNLEDPCFEMNACVNEGRCLVAENGTHAFFSCECRSGFKGPTCEKVEEASLNPESLAIVIGPVIGGTALITIIAVVVFLMMARKKRATRGTYSPSRQEMFGSRVEMGHVMKPPPEERLI